MAALITAASVGTANIYTGSNSGDKSAPCVICVAVNAEADDPPGSGNKWVTMDVHVKSIFAIDADGVDPVADADTLAGAVFNAVQTDTLAADLTTNGTDFTCMGVVFDGNASEPQDDCNVETMTLRLYCCPSAVG